MHVHGQSFKYRRFLPSLRIQLGTKAVQVRRRNDIFARKGRVHSQEMVFVNDIPYSESSSSDVIVEDGRTRKCDKCR